WGGAAIHLGHRRVLELVARRRRHLAQVVGVDQGAGGRVRRAVVDHHDLEARIALREQRAHRLEDDGLLVEGGYNDRDPRRERRRKGLLVPGPAAAADGARHAPPRERPEQQIREVEGEGVDGRDEPDDLDGRPHATPASIRLAAWRSCGWASVSPPNWTTSPGATAVRARAATSATSTSSWWTSRRSVGALRSSPTATSASAADMRTPSTSSMSSSSSASQASSAPRRARASQARRRTIGASSSSRSRRERLSRGLPSRPSSS